MLDTISGHFLSLLAHIVLVGTLYFNQEPFLLASSPLCVTKPPEDARVEFVVLLSLTILVDLGELIILLMKVPSVGLSILSSFFHAVSCLFLLKFIIDEHPISDFWMLLAFTSVPVLIFNLIGFSTFPFSPSFYHCFYYSGSYYKLEVSVNELPEADSNVHAKKKTAEVLY